MSIINACLIKTKKLKQNTNGNNKINWIKKLVSIILFLLKTLQLGWESDQL
jgi:hypothetical protein